MRRITAIVHAVAFCVTISSALAGECSNPNALGTSRTLVIDNTSHPRLGAQQYSETLPLADHGLTFFTACKMPGGYCLFFLYKHAASTPDTQAPAARGAGGGGGGGRWVGGGGVVWGGGGVGLWGGKALRGPTPPTQTHQKE